MIDDDVVIRHVDFPCCTAGGMVMPNDDGTYSVYLNSRLSAAQQLASLHHELRHIAHDDFSRPLDVERLEEEAG